MIAGNRGHSIALCVDHLQIYATWIFYALLNDLSAQVAVALNQPLERISVENETAIAGFPHCRI